MSKVHIKVCGLKSYENAVDVTALPVDMVGFNFYGPSSRFIPYGVEIGLGTLNTNKVGVFVDEDLEVIAQHVEAYKLNYIQLHGHESPAFCRQVSKYGKVIKAFGIKIKEDFNDLEAYEENCSLFLFDYKSDQYGGTGNKFDWELLSAYTGLTPFLLAGGIGYEDAEKVLELNHSSFFGLDLNSKFEISPGIKDVGLLNEFIQKIKGH